MDARLGSVVGLMTLEETLASFVIGARREDIPASVADRVKELFLDAVASALTGGRTDEAPAMARAAAQLGDTGRSTVIGGGRQSAAGATLLNAYLITAATACDVHRPTLCHVTPVVVPPALALAERRTSSGPDLLMALAVGFGTAVRIGLATDYPTFRSRGWHSPGVVGPFGGAAAGSRLLGLDAEATRQALGLAGSQAAGTFAGLGSAQVKFHQARGAVSGLLAALVAAEGFDAGRLFLTASDGGFLATYTDGGRPERLTDGFGSTWQLMDISLRRWPSASALQPVAEAALHHVEEVGVAVESTAGVEVALPPGAFRLDGGRSWHDQLSAFQSAAYVAAVTLIDGRCWLEQFGPGRLASDDVAAFVRDRVEVVEDAALPTSGARLTVMPRNGRSRSIQVDVPAGDPLRPLSEDQIREKLDASTAGTPLESRSREIGDMVLGLDEALTLEPLLAVLRGEAS